MLRITTLDISDEVLDKIETKHRVSFEEVEEACYSDERHVRRGREGLYEVWSRTEAGRYLLVVLAPRGSGVFVVVTAREMDLGEQRSYRRVKGM